MNISFRSSKNNLYIANPKSNANNAFAMAGYGKRLRDRAAELGVSDAEVARRSGISARRYSNYVNEKRQPDFDLFVEICRNLRTTPNKMLGLDGRGESCDAIPDLPEAVSAPEDYVGLRFVDIRPGMGDGAFEDHSGEGDLVFFPPDVIRLLRTPADHLRVLEVEGPSMSPILEHLDRVIVDTTKRNPSQPAIFVLWDGHGTVCKWVERVPRSDPPKLRIISENDRFKPYEAIEEEANIVGRVVWFARQI